MMLSNMMTTLSRYGKKDMYSDTEFSNVYKESNTQKRKAAKAGSMKMPRVTCGKAADIG